jgi:Transcriptional regulator, AbiEi antitoxin
MPHQDRTLAQLASSSHGVVTRAQLVAAGLTLEEIRHRLQSGALLREYRGVYRVGHRAASVEAWYLAAVWACGRAALLSGRAAGHLLGLLTTPPSMPEVTAPTERRVPGIRTHRSRAPVEAFVWRGIPVTTPARTLVDLSSVLAVSELARACHEAGIRHGTAPGEVEAIMGERTGAKKLRRVLRGDEHVTLSVLERRFLALLRSAGLPLPVTNRPAGGRYVDCRWVEQRFARGDDFRRYTYGDVFDHPAPMLAELHSVLV